MADGLPPGLDAAALTGHERKQLCAQVKDGAARGKGCGNAVAVLERFVRDLETMVGFAVEACFEGVKKEEP